MGLLKCGLFSDFKYGFKSSRSTADLLTVVSEKIARAFNMSGTTQAVGLDISKAFDRIRHDSLLHIGKSYGFQVQHWVLLTLFSVIDSFKWFWMWSLQKNIQLVLEFLKAPFIDNTFPVIYKWPSWWCYLWYCYLRWWSYSLL